MKTYVLTVSQVFPSQHPRKGQPTHFGNNILYGDKIHTIRKNYQFWKRRIDKINAGEAVLSLRVWSGKPYCSKQIEVIEFSKVGIQKLQWTVLGWFVDEYDNDVKSRDLAKHDGLEYEDFIKWFYPFSEEPYAIIHFTDFRY